MLKTAAPSKTFELGLPQIAGANALTVLPSASEVGERLDQAVALHNAGLIAFDQLTRFRGTRPRTALQATNDWLKRKKAGEVDHVLTACFGGAIASVCLGFGLGALFDSAVVGFATAGVSWAAALGTIPLPRLTGRLAARQSAKSAENRVQAAELRADLKAFEDARGTEKVLRGRLLGEWHDAMNDAEMLSPQARVELRKVSELTKTLPASDIARADCLRVILHEVSRDGTVIPRHIEAIAKAIEGAPAAEQSALAEKALELVQSSKRKIAYEATHVMHALADKYGLTETNAG